MNEYLLIRLEAPLQSWGGVALDPKRPTREFPSRSALAGLLASALGWRYSDGARTTTLQDALSYAVREDRPPRTLQDYQTVDLGRDATGWTRWGREQRGGASADETHVLQKEYLADASLLVALTLEEDEAPVGLNELAEALREPARPLFLGRKSCPPAVQLLEGRIDAPSGHEALRRAPVDSPSGGDLAHMRCWYEVGDGPEEPDARVREVWDRRDFASDRFAGSRRVVEGRVQPTTSSETEAAR